MSEINLLAEEMAQLAGDFLAGLDDEQRAKATESFGNDEERRRWYYTPTVREGLMLTDMRPLQQQKVMKLLAKGLSEAGYNYCSTILGLENLVDYHSNFPARPYGNLEGTRLRDPRNYFVAVFGEPGDESGWSWRIGGHHVSLHYTIKGGLVSPTPAFFGAEPAHFPMPGGREIRPLAAEEDYARELLAMLDPDQRSRAVISPIAPTDIVQTNRPRVEANVLPTISTAGPAGPDLRARLGLTPEHDEMLRFTEPPKGVPARDMTQSQRETFIRLVRTYMEHVPDVVAEQYASLLEPQRFDSTHFAWAGPDSRGDGHYYRVQGDRLLIEYDCTQNDANHTHSVWRDPQGDFGEDILAQHYAAGHAG